MGLIQRLFSASKPPAFEASRLQLAPAASQQFPLSQNATRRELLRVVLRDTLHRQGIPSEWIVGEPLATTGRDGGARGLHWRLLIKHWDERLVTHGVALQQALTKRVMTFDPLASSWLHGISWQYALDDESACPPLPPAGSWTTRAQPAAPRAADAPLHISGVAVASEAETAKADLDQLLAVRDADFQRHAEGDGPGWSRTEPAKL